MANWQITDGNNKTFIYKNGGMKPQYIFKWDEAQNAWVGHGRKFAKRTGIRAFLALNENKLEELLK